jgi:hypothetical protein
MTQSSSDQPAQIDQVRAVIAQFEAIGLSDHREADFLRSCESMLSLRGRVTPGMERWMLHILETGGPKMPTPATLDEIRRIEEYLPDAGVQEDLLLSARDLLKFGRELTARHREAVEDVILRISRSRREGDLREGELRALAFSRQVLDGYPLVYRRERYRSFETAYAVCNKFESGEKVTRVDWEALVSVAARLRDIAHPKFEIGDLLYAKHLDKIVVVVSLPAPGSNGEVCYRVLLDGALTMVNQAGLRTRIPRGD